MKANCGCVFSDVEIKKEAFVKSITKYQPWFACCAFCIVETISEAAGAMDGTLLFHPL